MERAKYGDLIIWKEILRQVEGSRTKLIFVENETKEDWWANYSERAIQPHLLAEYKESAPNGTFCIMDLKSFLDSYQEELSLPSGEAIALVRRLEFRDKVVEYLRENGSSLLEDGPIKRLYDEDYFYDTISDLPIRFGYIEGTVEHDIKSITVSNVKVFNDRNCGELYIEGQVLVDCTATVSCYISNEFSISEEYAFKFQFHMSTPVDVDYGDLTVMPGNAIELYDCSISNMILLREKCINREFFDRDT